MSTTLKRASYIEEIIEVKPSTELISDEYEHFNNGGAAKIALHTFIEEEDDENNVNTENEKQFIRSLGFCGFEFKRENHHSLHEIDFDNCIKKIVNDANEFNEGLILFFSGDAAEDGVLHVNGGKLSVQEVWSKFDSSNCPALKNKPKIFIFTLTCALGAIQVDGKRHGKQGVYDTPAEADILIIYNIKFSKGEDEFLTDFCKNISEFGDEENIVTLATISSTENTLLISTLTRSFYFTSSDLRGHHRVIRKHADRIDDHLGEMQTLMNTRSKDKKVKRSFLDSFRIPKRNNKEEQETEKKNKKESKKEEEKKKEEDENEKGKEKQDEIARIVPAKGQSGPSGQFRPRSSSQTESDSRRASIRRPSDKKGRPAWRP